MRPLVLSLALLATVCALVPATAGAGVPTKTVKVQDGYFSPSRLTVRPGTIVRWVWPAGLSDTHDVMLGRGPAGVRHFMSEYAASDYTYRKRLWKVGTYSLLCDLHQGMNMKVVVRR